MMGYRMMYIMHYLKISRRFSWGLRWGSRMFWVFKIFIAYKVPPFKSLLQDEMWIIKSRTTSKYMRNWLILYEKIIQKEFWGHLQKVDYLLNLISDEKIQREKKVPPWIYPAVIPLLEWLCHFLMSYWPRNEFNWLLFIFYSLHSQMGFWGFGVVRRIAISPSV
jgi:hypothetical protein